MVKSEKDKGIDGYGEAGDMYRKNKCRKSIYVKGLLVFVLAPPEGYIPRHYRGTPLKTLYLQLQNNLYFAIANIRSSEGYGEAGGYVYENTYRKSIYVKGLLVFMLAPPAGYIPRHCRGTPLKMGR